MSANSRIEWTDATVNFWWGCDEVSPACAHCYAREWAKFVSRQLFGRVVEWGRGKLRAERLTAARKEALALNAKAEKAGTRIRVFANSMSDWLDEEVPIEWLAVMLRTIHETPWLDWQLLTKRPENWERRLQESYRFSFSYGSISISARYFIDHWIWGKPPTNVWVGTTVEDQTRADERIPSLLRIPAAVRFLSCEPLLGAVRIARWGTMQCTCAVRDLHWIIAGGESGPHARGMSAIWARDLRDQCRAANVPFHFKQWGEWLPESQLAQMLEAGETPGLLQAMGRGKIRALGCETLYLVGKKMAGRLLDGRECNELPTTHGAEVLR